MLSFLGKMMKSKTIIVNALTVAVGVAGYMAGHEVIATHPEVVSLLVAGAGVLNVALRLITSIPVAQK